jgi:hypothetical protein
MKGKQLKGNDYITLLDGNTYSFKYSFNSLVELEERYGAIENIEKQFKTINLKNIRHLIYAGLIDEKELNEKHHLTEQYVGAHFDLQTIQQTVGMINEAFTRAFGSGKNGQMEIQEEIPESAKEALAEAKKKD